MSNNTPAVREDAPLPELADTPTASSLDATDVALLRLYRGEASSAAVQSDLVPKGSIYLASDGDDDEPEVLLEDAVSTPDDEGVLVHVLHSWKGLSGTNPDTKEFRSYRWGDQSAPEWARKTYHYLVVVPEYDSEVPVKLTLGKSSRKVGERINYQLLKHGPEEKYHELAFRLTLKQRQKTADGQTFRWYVWVAKLVEADKKHVKAAAELVAFAQAASAKADPVERSSAKNESDLPPI